MTGECFNCGETGYNKADCTNPKVERSFTGTCRTCGAEGHRSSGCADAVCKKCSGSGHTAAACTEKYDVYPKDLPSTDDADKAWENLLAADATGDVDDFFQAFWIYCKVAPELTLVQLEECFRETDFKYYLIAKEQTVPSPSIPMSTSRATPTRSFKSPSRRLPNLVVPSWLRVGPRLPKRTSNVYTMLASPGTT
ncbi:unnamed protein product [Aureobasidium vineae]|uniref:CCHC-type domain-containing protein n=1 Tax=Aureobasidium vineae TaxID=2773715 RepID=A0A9N8JXI9_9PEZI|nr:unnamed protein product [Aureobasidium vineae]